MKIDPINCKAYLHDCEIFQVDAIKGDEFRTVGRGKDITEAVAKLIDKLKEHGFPSHKFSIDDRS